MTTYQRTLRQIQPVIPGLMEALRSGIDEANARHSGAAGLRREDDESYWSYTVRRTACDVLDRKGIYMSVRNEDGREALSGISIQYDNVWLRVLRPILDRQGRPTVPVPGHSHARQAFYRQEPVQDFDSLDGVVPNNILVLWRDKDGSLREPLTMVRPLGGDHQQRNLLTDWRGPLSSDMGTMRAADLDELEPTIINPRLGDIIIQ